MDYLIHVANLLILGSFLVRDILWLRLLSIGGGLSGGLSCHRWHQPQLNRRHQYWIEFSPE